MGLVRHLVGQDGEDVAINEKREEILVRRSFYLQKFIKFFAEKFKESAKKPKSDERADWKYKESLMFAFAAARDQVIE